MPSCACATIHQFERAVLGFLQVVVTAAVVGRQLSVVAAWGNRPGLCSRAITGGITTLQRHNVICISLTKELAAYTCSHSPLPSPPSPWHQPVSARQVHVACVLGAGAGASTHTCTCVTSYASCGGCRKSSAPAAAISVTNCLLGICFLLAVGC